MNIEEGEKAFTALDKERYFEDYIESKILEQSLYLRFSECNYQIHF